MIILSLIYTPNTCTGITSYLVSVASPPSDLNGQFFYIFIYINFDGYCTYHNVRRASNFACALGSPTIRSIQLVVIIAVIKYIIYNYNKYVLQIRCGCSYIQQYRKLCVCTLINLIVQCNWGWIQLDSQACCLSK